MEGMHASNAATETIHRDGERGETAGSWALKCCSESSKKTPTDGLGMTVPTRLWNTTFLSRFATNTRRSHSGGPSCQALCGIYSQNSCFLKNLHQNHQDFIEEKLGSSVEHLRALFSLANAILKLLTEETRETLKLKETLSAVQANFLSLAIWYICYWFHQQCTINNFFKSYYKLFSPVPILMVCSICSLPDVCAQDGPVRF